MKPFTSVVLAAMLGTTAVVALSESANAGSPHDYYQVEVYRVRLPHIRVQHERVYYYPEHRREYRPRRYTRIRDDRSNYYPRVDYREYRSRDYRGDRDHQYDYYEHHERYWNY